MLFRKKQKGFLEPKVTSLSTHIVLPRYTQDVWKQLFPHMEEGNWEVINQPRSLIDFLDFTISALERKGCSFKNVEDISVVTLGQEYTDWLEENHLMHTPDQYLNYFQTLTPDDTNRLSVKYHLNHNIQCATLPMVVIKDDAFQTNSNFHMSKETHDNLVAYFGSIFGSDRIYIPPYYFKGDVCVNDYSTLYNMAYVYFTEHQNIRYEKFTSQDFDTDDVNLTYFYVMIFTYEECDSAVFTYQNLYLREDGKVNPLRIPSCVILNSNEEFPNSPSEVSFAGQPVPVEDLKKDFPDSKVQVADFLVDVLEIPHFEIESLWVLCENSEELGIMIADRKH